MDMREARDVMGQCWSRRVVLGATLWTLRLVRVLCLAGIPLLIFDLVCFGIVNCGVRSAVFPLVRAEALASCVDSLDEEEGALVEASYSAPNSSGVRRFVGEPSQLQTFSPLSLALSRAAGGRGALRVVQGMRQVREEYVNLGFDQSVLRDAYVGRTVRFLASVLVALAMDSLSLHLVERRRTRNSSPTPSNASGVEHVLNVV